MTWKEIVPAGEAELFEKLAAELGGMQQTLAAKRGIQRGLHAKPNIVARATFEVKAVPESHRVGLFASPKTFDAVVRFSNGGPAAQADKKPDVRGIAVKVLGVEGEKCIPGFVHSTQDFLAILSDVVPFRSPEEFVFFVVNARNPLALLPKAIFKLGAGRTFSLLGQLQKGLGAPLTSLHSNRYFSALPIRFGTMAAKFCFTPRGEQSVKTQAVDLGSEFATRLGAAELQWDFQVQLYADETSTPIEDPTVAWNTPWTTLATLTLAKQTIDAKFSAWTESLSFDPWHAQAELRPVGAMMRARNAAYRVSTKARNAAGEPTSIPS